MNRALIAIAAGALLIALSLLPEITFLLTGWELPS